MFQAKFMFKILQQLRYIEMIRGVPWLVSLRRRNFWFQSYSYVSANFVVEFVTGCYGNRYGGESTLHPWRQALYGTGF